MYFLGWSNLYPALPGSLLIFFTISFTLFILAGKKEIINFDVTHEKVVLDMRKKYVFDNLIFIVIMSLGLINILKMGYLPILASNHDYRDFGIPIIDPLFNTLSIFFAVFFFQSYLQCRKRRLLAYVILIIIFQLLIFRRSSAIWISMSMIFIYIINHKRISYAVLISLFLLIPVISYCFGLYGNKRSNLSKEYVLNDLGASDSFINTGLDDNHYMTYLYVTSPLANLNANLLQGEGLFNKKEYEKFIFYCLVPYSITLRVENVMNISPPQTYLIHPHLIVGTFLMEGFYTMGWFGMSAMIIYLFLYISVCNLIIKRFCILRSTAVSLLCTTVSLLIFSNFLNRLDVILLLFVYPVLFHLLYDRYAKCKPSAIW